jgi:DNA polymerase-3 subunit delta
MLITSANIKDWTPGTAPKSLQKANAVLIFGADEGGAYALAQDLLAGLESPTRLNEDEITSSHLTSLLTTGSLFGPAPPLLVTGIKDTHRDALDAALSTQSDTLMVVVAGDLKKTSKLVKLFDEKAIGVQLYPLDLQGSLSWLQKALAEQKMTISTNASKMAQPQLPGNRMEITRLSEVLTLSALGRNSKTVDIEDIQSVLSDFSDIDLGGALDAALSGRLDTALTRLDRQLTSGENPIALFRIWAYRLTRLNDMSLAGLDPKTAVAKARPPVFWKDKAFFETALQKLGDKGAGHLLSLLDCTEKFSVEKGQPPRILAERFLANAASYKKG